jgi:histidine ammonia-lyase
LQLRAPLSPAAATDAVVDLLRRHSDRPGPDRWLAPELAAVEQLVHARAITTAVSDAIGDLE